MAATLSHIIVEHDNIDSTNQRNNPPASHHTIGQQHLHEQHSPHHFESPASVMLDPLPPMALAADMANALEHWHHFQHYLAGKTPVVFLDYDGTLSPIVKEPDKAFMSESMRGALRRVARTFTTAIITGRSREKVYQFVRLNDVFYAGSHGFDISGPDHIPLTCQVGEQYRPLLESARAQLEETLQSIPGAQVEDNKFALSVHYRNVGVEHVDTVRATVDEVIEMNTDLMLKHGKRVFELRPNLDWNKGSAVLWILEQLGLKDRSDVFPLYLGDDLTDEDAFVALRSIAFPSSFGQQEQGAGILIREDGDLERQPETHASFKLRNPDEVEQFLNRLVDTTEGGGAPR